MRRGGVSFLDTILPRNASPVPMSAPTSGFGGWSSRNGGRDRTGELGSMSSTGTLFSVVSTLASDTSAVEWNLYPVRKPGEPESADREPIAYRHAAVDLWNRPNRFYTRQEFVESGQQHVDLTGEAYMVVEKADGFDLPIGLWLVRPDRMTPVPDPHEFLVGWVYSSPDGEKVPLELDEVIQIRMPDPMDPYRGLGPLASVSVDVDAARAAAEWNRNFFRNSAEPGGVIEVPTELSDKAFNKLVAQWSQQHRGVSRAHRVAVLEAGAKWNSASYSMKDMQFTELRRVSAEVLWEAYGVSKTVLGLTEDVNRATAETADLMYGKKRLMPRLERWKRALNNDLLPMFGTTASGVEFDYCLHLPEDVEAENSTLSAKTQALATLVAAGFDEGEACDVVGLPRMTLRAQGGAPSEPQPA